MEESIGTLSQLAATAKQLVRRLLTIAENRLELLTVEVQEERERLLHAILLTLGVAVFGCLAGVALSVAIVILLWDFSPVAVLLGLTGLYGAIAGCLYWRLTAFQSDRKTLPATLDQLRKDGICLKKNLG